MASKTKSAINRSLGNLDIAINKELINNVKLHPSLWYTVKYTLKDEIHWNSISTEMGIQKSWLKRRWHQLRTEYHNNNQNNPILSNHLSFLKKTKKGAAIGGGNMREDHQTEEGDEFHVTQEQLDESTGETSSNDENTINFDVDNESAESFEDYEVTIVSDAGDAVSNDLQTCETKNATKTKTITIEKVLERRVDTSKRKPAANLNVEKSPIALKASSEVNEVDYQDKVFGDLVSAMLAEMTPEKKKQARKEIMNILL